MKTYSMAGFCRKIKRTPTFVKIIDVRRATVRNRPALVIAMRETESGNRFAVALRHDQESRQFYEELTTQLGHNETVDRFFNLQ
ncbi:MAG TPA: hypothetical protein VGH47_00155 [Xanthobacteraceae bacterium]